MKYDTEIMNKALFTTQEIASIFNSEKSMQRVLNNFVTGGKIVRIKNGLYATVNPLTGEAFANRFEVATAMAPKGYVGYHSALEYHGLSNQMFRMVYVVSDIVYRPVEFDGLEYRFVKAPISSGLISLEQNSEIRITDIERTILDCINRIDLAGGLDELVLALNSITYLDENKLLSYLDKFNIKTLYKKTGYLLQAVKAKYLSDKFYQYCKSKMSTRLDSIVENKKINSHLNKEWNLTVPDDLMNTEN